METNRVEAFSDGVLAIAITIMVLELKIPDTPDLHGLGEIVPTLLTYVLSFVYIGIYWTNHHHLMHLTSRVDGGALWANLNLLFWLSIVPFTTRWMDESALATLPVLVYGVNLLAAAVSYTIFQSRLIRLQGSESRLAHAISNDAKGKWSMAIYVAGCAGTLLSVWIGVAAYVVVATIWIVPDRRIERAVEGNSTAGDDA
ncbi:TMEM175 family protein [Sinomonas sp. ASV486]|uniref:TMEM175 family protein n=1 Tax=Sinomonas sp. ASV486 TaxID=3051170 RepID=UPI0027DB9D36|nr:TMEM175 family protein [Sinomonas sp. ASV486]MDQ4491347.1 TMEM175 family protein [Sinomonas sp. ASV486]